LAIQVACARPSLPSPAEAGAPPEPRGLETPSAPLPSSEPQSSDLANAQAAVMRALVSCSYNPQATPYGLEYEWFRATVTYASSGEPMSARVVRVSDGSPDAKVTRCLVAHLRADRAWISTADASRDVAYPLGGRWR
jgi:hypothetical protein